MNSPTSTDSPETRDRQAAMPAPLTRQSPRGRPSLMNPPAVLEKIRQLASREHGLFRIHHTHSGLYARARRQFGSWAEAVRAAGIDYGHSLEVARRRSSDGRRRRRRNAFRPKP